MKRLLVGFILLLNVVAYAETPARVRLRVRLPFDSSSPSAVVLPPGTLVTVLWPQEDKLMIRYRRVEGLVPAVTIHYDASAHPGDVRQYRPDPEPRENDSVAAPVERTVNTYHAPATDSTAASNDAMFGSLPMGKILGGLGAVVLLLLITSRSGKNEGNAGPQFR